MTTPAKDQPSQTTNAGTAAALASPTTPCPASSEPLHVYDWLDLPAKDEDERQAKEWLNKFSKPAYVKFMNGTGDWLAARTLTCAWKGERYYCRGCSRMGDVWITKDPTGNTYYDHRVDVEDCSDWKRFEGSVILQNI